MSSSLLPQQCPACLVRLIWIVFVVGGRRPYSWYLVEFCRWQHSCVIVIFSSTYMQNHNDTINKQTHAGRLLYKYMYLSLYCKSSKRVTQGFRVRGSCRPNINCNILTPTLMAVNVVSFSFSRCSTGGPGVHSAGCWLSLLHLISNFSGPKLHRCSRGPLPHSSITPSPTVTATVLTSVLTELYNSSTPTRSPTRSSKSHV